MTPADSQNPTNPPAAPASSVERAECVEARPVPEPGEGSFDFSVFLALVKETAHHLRRFRPPENFQPEEPPRPPALTPDMIRDLGAASLEDFYSQALEGRRPEESEAQAGGLTEFFPKGPESIRPALSAVEAEITRLTLAATDFEKSWPSARPGLEEARRALGQRLARLKETRAGLMAAARLWPRLKIETDKWPETVKGLWRKTRRLEEVVTPLLVAVREATGGGEEEGGNVSRRDLIRTAVGVKAETDAARKTADERVHWAANLEALLAELDQLLDQVVKSPSADKDWGQAGLGLSERLSTLEAEERRLAEESMRNVLALSRTLSGLAGLEKTFTATDGELRERLEIADQAATVLWRATEGRRREMALLYFALPSRLGRPVHLEKLFLGLALGLGRTQARLEELRRRLTLAGERLPDTKKMRAEAENFMARLGPPLPRIGELKGARRRLSVLLKAAGQSRSLSELKTQLDRVRQTGRETDRERNRGLVENRRIRKELESANSALRIANQEKARLEELLTAARQGLEAVSQVKPKLLKAFTDKAEFLLAAERDRWAARLTRHRAVVRRLVALRQVLRSELSEAGLKLASLDNERRFLGAQLAEVRVRNRDVEANNEELRSRASALEEENGSLAARLLALDAAKSDLDRRVGRLTEEKTLLTETETRLTDQIAELTDQAAELEREREDLAGRLGDLEARVRDDLAPLIQCLMTALWRNGVQLKRARAAVPRVREEAWAEARQEADLREANLRLAAAAREIKLVESALTERNRMDALLAERDGELARTREEAARTALARETAATRLRGRSQKLSRALGTLKRRYSRRLEEARLTEGGLRDYIEQQRHALADGGPPLEPLMDHFFDQAAQSFTPEEEAGRDLALSLQAEGRELLAGAGEAPGEGGAQAEIPSIAEKRRAFSPREFNRLQARLEELQPVVAFLARSFVSGVAELAQARRERASLAAALADFQASDLGVERDLARAREAELIDLRDQAFALARERDQLRETLAVKEDDIRTLKQELAQADRDLAENDGRLEASWAALNYLGTRAGDTLGNMKSKLETQARQVDSLSLELNRRTARVKELEDRQDKLALVYWALIAKAVRETAVSGAPVPVLTPVPAQAPAQLPAPAAPVPFAAAPAQPADQREVLTRPLSANYK